MRKKVLAEKSVKQGLNQFQYIEQLGKLEFWSELNGFKSKSEAIKN